MPHRLVQAHTVHAQVHGAGSFGRFNSWLAVQITNSVGSMVCAYIFFGIALISLPAAFAALLHGDTLTAIAWLSQSCIQLVLLPIIIVGNRVISMAQDERAQTDHDTLQLLQKINRTQLAILRHLEKDHESSALPSLQQSAQSQRLG